MPPSTRRHPHLGRGRRWQQQQQRRRRQRRLASAFEALENVASKVAVLGCGRNGGDVDVADDDDDSGRSWTGSRLRDNARRQSSFSWQQRVGRWSSATRPSGLASSDRALLRPTRRRQENHRRRRQRAYKQIYTFKNDVEEMEFIVGRRERWLSSSSSSSSTEAYQTMVNATVDRSLSAMSAVVFSWPKPRLLLLLLLVCCRPASDRVALPPYSDAATQTAGSVLMSPTRLRCQWGNESDTEMGTVAGNAISAWLRAVRSRDWAARRSGRSTNVGHKCRTYTLMINTLVRRLRASGLRARRTVRRLSQPFYLLICQSSFED